jgi:hypothetical protein
VEPRPGQTANVSTPQKAEQFQDLSSTFSSLAEGLFTSFPNSTVDTQTENISVYENCLSVVALQLSLTCPDGHHIKQGRDYLILTHTPYFFNPQHPQAVE